MSDQDKPTAGKWTVHEDGYGILEWHPKHKDGVGMLCRCHDRMEAEYTVNAHKAALAAAEREKVATRILKKGETIQEGDEFDACRDPMKDEPEWKPVPIHMIGKTVSDPAFPAHTLYRRCIATENQQLNAALVAEREKYEAACEGRDQFKAQLSDADKQLADERERAVASIALELHDARQLLAAEREKVKACHIVISDMRESNANFAVRAERDEWKEKVQALVAALTAEREKPKTTEYAQGWDDHVLAARSQLTAEREKHGKWVIEGELLRQELTLDVQMLVDALKEIAKDDASTPNNDPCSIYTRIAAAALAKIGEK